MRVIKKKDGSYRIVGMRCPRCGKFIPTGHWYCPVNSPCERSRSK